MIVDEHLRAGVVGRSAGRRHIGASRRLHVLVVMLAVGVLGSACSSSTAGSGSVTPTTAQTDTVIKVLLNEGIAQADANMPIQARTSFNDVLLVDPGDTYALYNLGLLDQDQHDTAGAVSYYNRALRADPTYTPAMYNKAIILEASDPQGALALYERIIGLNPKASTAYLRMAIVYATRGEVARAKAARQHAVALDPALARYQLPES